MSHALDLAAAPRDGAVYLDQRWKRRSRWAATASLAFAILFPTSIVVALAIDPSSAFPAGAGVLQTLGIAAALSLPIGAATLAFVAVYRLLDRFARGLVFTHGTFSAMRRFAWVSIAAAIAQFVSVPLITVLSTLHLASGERSGSIAVDIGMLLGLLIGFVFLLTASVMAEGKRLADDNEAFV